MVDSPPRLEKTVRKRASANRTARTRYCARVTAIRHSSISAQFSRSADPAELLEPSIKKEHALWRAFCGEEIDAILFDKD